MGTSWSRKASPTPTAACTGVDSCVPDKLYTGMAHGGAGVAMMLLQVHESSPDAA